MSSLPSEHKWRKLAAPRTFSFPGVDSKHITQSPVKDAQGQVEDAVASLDQQSPFGDASIPLQTSSNETYSEQLSTEGEASLGQNMPNDDSVGNDTGADEECRQDAYENDYTQGYEAGFKQGNLDASTEANDRLAEQLQLLNQCINILNQQAEVIVDKYSENLAELIPELFVALFDIHLSSTPELLQQLFNEALGTYDIANLMHIDLHPEDVDLMKAVVDADVQNLFLANASLDRGVIRFCKPDRIDELNLTANLKTLFKESSALTIRA